MWSPDQLATSPPLSRFKAAFEHLPNLETYHFYIAFSGGLDSHILLHATQQLFPNAQLTAIHINHGWNQAAKQWEAHCQSVCNQLAIPLIIENVADLLHSKNFLKDSHGPEEAARKARYAALQRHLSNQDCLLTGHHAEDQAETLLLQLARGSGIQGLASMPLLNQFGVGHHLRPLLTWSHEERLLYGQQHQLQWIEDSSNLDIRFRRNFIRHQALPLLREKWPHITNTLARTAAHCAEANALSTELAVQDLAHCQINDRCISITALSCLSYLRRRNTLRYWLQQQAIVPLTTVQFLSIEKLLDSKQTVSQFNVKQLLVKRYRDYLYAFQPTDFPSNSSTVIEWNWKTPIELPYFGRLNATQTYGHGIRLSAFTKNPTITLRFRKGGERFQPNGRSGSHPVKKLYQEWNIPPWERDYIPLLYLGDKLVSIPGYAIAENYAAASDEMGITIEVQKPSTPNIRTSYSL